MKKSFITKLLTAITVVASSLFIGTACEPEHTHNFVPTVTPATCTESGYTTYNCECGEDSYVGDNTSALGHNYQNYVSNNDATYLQDGTETGRCIRCNRTHTRNDSGTKLASSWEFDGLEEVEEDEAYKVDGKLSNATTTYNLDEKIVKVGYTYKVFKGDDEVTDSQALPLTEGENEFTVKNYLNDVEQDTYVVTIYRKKMFTVTFDTKGGSTIDSVQVEEDAKVSAPTEPTKTGYVFSSWNHVFETPITSNITIEASWNAGIVNYTVEYYLEQLDGTFVKADAETETKQGTTGASVTAVPKTTINHFTFDENNAENALTATVNADGSTVFKAYFARNSYTVTFKDGEATLKEETVKYGASATAPTPTKDGYTLGWDVAFDNVAGNLTVNTEWTPKTDTPYVVEYYLERLDGTIVRNSIDNFKGTTDATVEADTTVAFAGQTFDANNELNVLSATVKADGSTVLKVYYTRNSHTVTFSFTEGELVGGDLVQTVKYEGDATAPIVKRDGYDLSWDASYSHVTSDLTINAVWTAKTDIAYKVEYYLEKLDGTFEKADTQNKQGTTDATVEADTTVTFDHFTFDATKDEELSATVNADGSTVLKVYYARNSYTVTFKNGEETVEETVKYEGSATAPTLTKTGYDLSWDIEFINVSSDITVNAVRTAKTNIAYKVEYYYENLDGNYDKLATENKQGTTDTEVTADVEVGNKPHYTFDEDNELNVLTDDALNGDGTTVLKVYYNLNEYTVKFTVKEREGETVETVSQNNMKYGATLTSPTYKVEGYIAVWTNVNWDAEVVDGVINFYTEAWRVTGDNFYTVKTYKESEDGVFDEISSQVVE
ncbi:MAG: InlB B-repeat-containing protein, partial [Clostridia bacterium]|nr:InlB B-repeat-containing protein [Clostridia bacterium]